VNPAHLNTLPCACWMTKRKRTKDSIRRRHLKICYLFQGITSVSPSSCQRMRSWRLGSRALLLLLPRPHPALTAPEISQEDFPLGRRGGCRDWGEAVGVVDIGEARRMHQVGVDQREAGEETFHHGEVSTETTIDALHLQDATADAIPLLLVARRRLDVEGAATGVIDARGRARALPDVETRDTIKF